MRQQMENLIFSLNATVPVFLLMVLGIFFHRMGWIDDTFASQMNRFVFKVPLPVLLFGDLAAVEAQIRAQAPGVLGGLSRAAQ